MALRFVGAVMRLISPRGHVEALQSRLNDCYIGWGRASVAFATAPRRGCSIMVRPMAPAHRRSRSRLDDRGLRIVHPARSAGRRLGDLNDDAADAIRVLPNDEPLAGAEASDVLGP